MFARAASITIVAQAVESSLDLSLGGSVIGAPAHVGPIHRLLIFSHSRINLAIDFRLTSAGRRRMLRAFCGIIILLTRAILVGLIYTSE
jgi:hypothetical protein